MKMLIRCFGFLEMQVSCFMGLFTSITRAWLAIDNLLFFWNYEDGYEIII